MKSKSSVAFTIPPTMSDPEPASPPASPLVAVKNLHVRYGKTHAVRGISLTIARGEVYGFIGPNGAGKTSTIKVLATLLRPNEGKVEVAGIDATENPAAVRRKIDSRW